MLHSDKPNGHNILGTTASTSSSSVDASENPTLADGRGADETKYTKRRSRRRMATARRNWKTVSLVASVATILVVMGVHYNSNVQWRQQQGKQHLLKRALHILAQRNNNNSINQEPIKEQHVRISPKRNQAELDDQDEEKRGDGKEQDKENAGDDKEKDNENPGDDKEEDETEKQTQKRRPPPVRGGKYTIEELIRMFQDLNGDVRGNVHGGIRWVQDHLLKELPGQKPNRLLEENPKGDARKKAKNAFRGTAVDFNVKRMRQSPMAWEAEWDKLTEEQRNRGPKVDYTKHSYTYPKKEPTPTEEYPHLETLEEMMKRWPQDSIDDPPDTIVEHLMHFDYSNEKEREMALNYRNAELPFKVYNVPDVDAATIKWTDEYVTAGFDGGKSYFFSESQRTMGTCQESHDNFFAFFSPPSWHIDKFGPPPTRNNDWTFKKWNQHAKYADAVSLSFDQPHFYWQAGVPREERYNSKNEWGFVSLDLPLFSSTQANFFQFNPEEQKGIQCRFGERGVTAATHYDTGRNMVAMVLGAKRYILSPPVECPKLGIVTAKGNSVYRHSLLNFGHIQYLDDASSKDGNAAMPAQERGWLEVSKKALAIETVLKAGEVLYIPSHWFHYITSLQRSGQCNVRSGINNVGTEKFGGPKEVSECEA
jgi:hypothetical protein